MPDIPVMKASATPTPTFDRTRRLNRRAMLATGGVLGVYVASVASHLGEFWPFSIYPMFSRAGRPWTRAMIIDVSEQANSSDWGPWSPTALPGPAVSTQSLGINTNDLSKFVQLTSEWTEQRLATLRRLCEPALAKGATLMLLRADGKLTENGDVDISLTPLVRIDARTATVNAQLETELA